MSWRYATITQSLSMNGMSGVEQQTLPTQHAGYSDTSNRVEH